MVQRYFSPASSGGRPPVTMGPYQETEEEARQRRLRELAARMPSVAKLLPSFFGATTDVATPPVPPIPPPPSVTIGPRTTFTEADRQRLLAEHPEGIYPRPSREERIQTLKKNEQIMVPPEPVEPGALGKIVGKLGEVLTTPVIPNPNVARLPFGKPSQLYPNPKLSMAEILENLEPVFMAVPPIGVPLRNVETALKQTGATLKALPSEEIGAVGKNIYKKAAPEASDVEKALMKYAEATPKPAGLKGSEIRVAPKEPVAVFIAKNYPKTGASNLWGILSEEQRAELMGSLGKELKGKNWSALNQDVERQLVARRIADIQVAAPDILKATPVAKAAVPAVKGATKAAKVGNELINDPTTMFPPDKLAKLSEVAKARGKTKLATAIDAYRSLPVEQMHLPENKIKLATVLKNETGYDVLSKRVVPKVPVGTTAAEYEKQGLSKAAIELHTDPTRLKKWEDVPKTEVGAYMKKLSAYALAKENGTPEVKALLVKTKKLLTQGDISKAHIQADELLTTLHGNELTRVKGTVGAVKPAVTMKPEPPVSTVKQVTKAKKAVGGLGGPPKPVVPPPVSTGEPPKDPVGKLISIIAKEKGAWQRTKGMRHEEMQRIAKNVSAAREAKDPETALRMALGSMAGARAKAKVHVNEWLTPDETKTLFGQLQKAKDRISPFEWVNAATGLREVLQKQMPSMYQLAQMEKVFGTDFARAILNKRLWGPRFFQELYGSLNLPRALMASADLSATLRQGGFLLAGHPADIPAFLKTQFKVFFSEKNFAKLKHELETMKWSSVAKDSGLDITLMDKTALPGGLIREEAYMSQFAEKIPWVRMAERSYVGGLNKLRMDVFSHIVEGWARKGWTFANHQNDFEQLASYINKATGRGSLGKLSGYTEPLNAVFFSPKLAVSRIQLPLMLLSSSKEVRKLAAKDLVAFVGVGLTALGIAKLGGAEVELDPRSSDFGKSKIGNTRVDFWAGMQPWARFVAQEISGKRKTLASGHIQPLNRMDLLMQFVRTKFSPTMAMAYGALSGKTVVGDDFWEISFGQALYQNLLPLSIQDIAEATQDAGMVGMVTALPTLFGASVQTFDSAAGIVGEVGTKYSELLAKKQQAEEMRRKQEDPSDFLAKNPDLQKYNLFSAANSSLARMKTHKRDITDNPSIPQAQKDEMLMALDENMKALAVQTMLAYDNLNLDVTAPETGYVPPPTPPTMTPVPTPGSRIPEKYQQWLQKK